MDPTYREAGFSLLNEMIERGNRVAHLRKSEIELLEELVQPLVQRHQTPPVSTDTVHGQLATPESQQRPLGQLEHLSGPSAEEVDSIPTVPPTDVPPDPEDELSLDWRGLGLSLDYMLSVTDQLNANNLVLDAEREGLQSDLWLWEDS